MNLVEWHNRVVRDVLSVVDYDYRVNGASTYEYSDNYGIFDFKDKLTILSRLLSPSEFKRNYKTFDSVINDYINNKPIAIIFMEKMLPYITTAKVAIAYGITLDDSVNKALFILNDNIREKYWKILMDNNIKIRFNNIFNQSYYDNIIFNNFWKTPISYYLMYIIDKGNTMLQTDTNFFYGSNIILYSFDCAIKLSNEYLVKYIGNILKNYKLSYSKEKILYYFMEAKTATILQILTNLLNSNEKRSIAAMMLFSNKNDILKYKPKDIREQFFMLAGIVKVNEFIKLHKDFSIRYCYAEYIEALKNGNNNLVIYLTQKGWPKIINSNRELNIIMQEVCNCDDETQKLVFTMVKNKRKQNKNKISPYIFGNLLNKTNLYEWYSEFYNWVSRITFEDFEQWKNFDFNKASSIRFLLDSGLIKLWKRACPTLLIKIYKDTPLSIQFALSIAKIGIERIYKK